MDRHENHYVLGGGGGGGGGKRLKYGPAHLIFGFIAYKSCECSDKPVHKSERSLIKQKEGT